MGVYCFLIFDTPPPIFLAFISTKPITTKILIENLIPWKNYTNKFQQPSHALCILHLFLWDWTVIPFSRNGSGSRRGTKKGEKEERGRKRGREEPRKRKGRGMPALPFPFLRDFYKKNIDIKIWSKIPKVTLASEVSKHAALHGVLFIFIVINNSTKKLQ